MKEEIFEKIIPEYYVYYKEGILKDYSELSEFILKGYPSSFILELPPYRRPQFIRIKS